MDFLEEIEYKLKNPPAFKTKTELEQYRGNLYMQRSRFKKRQEEQMYIAANSEIWALERLLAKAILKSLKERGAIKIPTRREIRERQEQERTRIVIAKHGSEEAQRLSKLVSEL